MISHIRISSRKIIGLLTVTLLFFGMATATPHAHAQTQEELTALINSLLAQIATLQEQLQNSQGYTTETLTTSTEVETISNLKVRSNPSTSGTLITVASAGSAGVIKSGPVQASGYTWWNVTFSNDVTGWVAGNWLREIGVQDMVSDAVDTSAIDDESNDREQAIEELEAAEEAIEDYEDRIADLDDSADKLTIQVSLSGARTTLDRAESAFDVRDYITVFGLVEDIYDVLDSVEEKIEDLEDDESNDREQAIEELEESEEAIEKYEDLVTDLKDSADKLKIQLLLKDANIFLSRAESAFDDRDYVTVFDLVDDIDDLLDSVEEMISDLEDDEDIVTDWNVDNASSIYVIGAYEGSYPNGESHSFNNHPQGSVTVNIDSRNGHNDSIMLVLMAYEPINWNITGDAIDRVDRVLLSGYYEQELTGLSSDVLTSSLSHENGDDEYFYAYDKTSVEFDKVADYVEELTGVLPYLFIGDYSVESVTPGLKG